MHFGLFHSVVKLYHMDARFCSPGDLCLSQPVLTRIPHRVPRARLECRHTFLSRNTCKSPDFTLSQELHASCRCTWFYSVARTSFIMSAMDLHTSTMLDGFCHASTRPVVKPPSHAVVYLEAGCLIRVPVSSTSRNGEMSIPSNAFTNASEQPL